MTRARVGFADLRLESPAFYIYGDGGHLTASGELPRPDGLDRLAAIASELAREGGHAVDLFIFLIPSGHQPKLAAECIAASPFPVIVVEEALAAAAAVPAFWTRFQLLDFNSRTWWLLDKTEGRLNSATSAPFPALPAEPAIDQLAAFCYDRIALLGDSGNRRLRLETHQITAEALLESAWQAAMSTRADGTGLRWDRAGRKVLDLAATRQVSFSVTHVDRPVFSPAEPALAELTGGRPVLTIVDKCVDQLYGPEIERYCRACLTRAGAIVLDNTERRKTGLAVARILKLATRLDFPRHGIFLAVGGGVTLDVAGLAASLYCRGVPYYRIPTTLVGLIDAGLGIKQAVNFGHKKNVAGAFYPPAAVISDVSFLKTLPLIEVSCGLAEIAKIAMVRDGELFETLEQYGPALRESRFRQPEGVAAGVLLRSSMLMLEELQPNLYESDLRRLVDFGHSFSPAIEMLSGCRIPHGHAVAMDMMLSTAIGYGRRLCSRAVVERLSSLLGSVDLPNGPPPCSIEDLSGALQSTRRRRAGNLNLVVPVAIGRAAFLQDVSRDEIAAAVDLIGRAPARQAREAYAGAAV